MGWSDGLCYLLPHKPALPQTKWGIIHFASKYITEQLPVLYLICPDFFVIVPPFILFLSLNYRIFYLITSDQMDAPRSSSRPRPPSSSRPTTPLRPSSRSSFREAHGYGGSISNTGYTQPAINALEPQFAELANSMGDLEANLMHLQLMHESLTRFSESFASFLYGLNMNAFCVDFPEVQCSTYYCFDAV